MITKYVSLTLTLTVTLTARYTSLLVPRACSQQMIVISSSVQRTAFQGVKYLPDINQTLTLILSFTLLPSKTTVIYTRHSKNSGAK